MEIQEQQQPANESRNTLLAQLRRQWRTWSAQIEHQPETDTIDISLAATTTATTATTAATEVTSSSSTGSLSVSSSGSPAMTTTTTTTKATSAPPRAGRMASRLAISLTTEGETSGDMMGSAPASPRRECEPVNLAVMRSFLLQLESTLPCHTGKIVANCKGFDHMFDTVKAHNLLADTVFHTAMVYLFRVCDGSHHAVVPPNFRPSFSGDFNNDDVYLPHSLFFHDMPGAAAVVASQDNIRMLFLVCLLIANKFVEDKSYDNFTFSTLGIVDLKFLNAWEMVVIKSMSFSLAVDDADLADASDRIRIAVATGMFKPM